MVSRARSQLAAGLVAVLLGVVVAPPQAVGATTAAPVEPLSTVADRHDDPPGHADDQWDDGSLIQGIGVGVLIVLLYVAAGLLATLLLALLLLGCALGVVNGLRWLFGRLRVTEVDEIG